MSPPDHFEVAYSINPWMSQEQAVDRDLARRQWDSLVQALTGPAGAEVDILPAVEGLPDLVFTANAAFVYKKTAVIARYKHAERQGEEPHAERWFREHGYRVVVLPKGQHFEGAGDALLYDNRIVLAGYRQRTDIFAHHSLSRETGLPLLSIELCDPYFYHIDVCLCPLSNGHLLFYPGAFDEYGLKVLEVNVPEEKRLMTTTREARQFACNAVCVNDTVVLNQPAPRLQEALQARGFQVVGVDLSEFIKAGGSAKCLTLRIA